MFGEPELINEAHGSVAARELLFLLVGSGRHCDDVAYATEKADLYAKRILREKAIEVKIEEQNIGSVFRGEIQSFFECSRDADKMKRPCALQQLRDQFANGGAVVGNHNAYGRVWDMTHARSPGWTIFAPLPRGANVGWESASIGNDLYYYKV